MGSQVVGTATFSSTAGAINLGTPLHDLRLRTAKNRLVAETLDLTAREVVTYGNGREEVEGLIRFHDNPQELVNLVKAGLDGGTLTYKHGSTYANITCKLIEAGKIEPDPDRVGMGEYQVRLTLRRLADNDDWSAIL